jgi:3-hydroxyacyl-[acyl-carrier-protein] dehydratase
MIILNTEQIKEIIPHRAPFLLIDEVIGLEPGIKCVALKYLKEDDFWVPGHFPGYAVTPGVLMSEMLAQAGAVCVGTMPEYKGKTALFAKIDNAKFRRQVLPGDVLTLEVEILKLRSQAGIGKARAHVNGETAVTAELTFAFAPQNTGA